MLQKALCAILTVCIVFSLVGCSDNMVLKNKTFDSKTSSLKPKNGDVIAENDSYKMIWVSSNCSVALIDKKNDLQFGTTPISEGEPTVGTLGMPIKKHALVESAVVIEHVNSDNKEDQSLSSTSVVKNGRVVTKKINSGISVEYYFDDVEIMIPVEYVLRDDSLLASINTNDIQENEQKVTSISLLPFWCSVKNDTENAYLVYPSGSGTLIKSDTISQTGVTYSSQVFGRDPVMTLDDCISSEKSIRLPVFGAKSDNYGSIAIIEDSSESAIIETKVGSSAIKYSAVYAKFQVRGYSKNLARFMQGVKKELNIYSSNMINGRTSVVFYPLNSEKSDYTHMANIYRKYLEDNNFLNSKSNDRALNFSFVGGTMVDRSFLGVPYKTLLSSTTVKEAQSITKDIKEKTDTSFNVKLLGFGTTGIENNSFAGGLKIGKELGTKNDLSNFSDYCIDNSLNLYFDFDIIKLKKGGSGYNRFFDVAFSSLNKIADVYKYDLVTRSKINESKYNLLSRELLSEASDKILKKVNSWNLSGISLNSLSNTAYSDYSIKDSTKYYSKGNICNDVTDILEKITEKYKISGDDANVYAAVLSDVVYNSPTRSSDENIFYCDIPFYQIVFKGKVALTGETINTSSNWKTTFLKSVESGCGLNYLLTGKYYTDYINYNGEEFFSSKYDDIKDKIFEDYSVSKEFYSKILNQEIVSHKILDNLLRETIFKNGVAVYVNYSDKDLVSLIGKVKALGFVWGEITE